MCNSADHQVRDCKLIRCWKCGSFGHKGKVCLNTERCNLCGADGHSFFGCPEWYSNCLRNVKISLATTVANEIAQSNSGDVMHQMVETPKQQMAEIETQALNEGQHIEHGAQEVSEGGGATSDSTSTGNEDTDTSSTSSTTSSGGSSMSDTEVENSDIKGSDMAGVVTQDSKSISRKVYILNFLLEIRHL